MKEKGVYTVSKKGKPSIDKKRADQLCGKVIVRDIESPYNSIIEIAIDPEHLQLTLSLQDGIPYLFFGNAPQPSAKAINAINKVLKFLDLKKETPKDHDHICGKLISWDVGTFQENSVKLSENYSPPAYKPTAKMELTPYIAPTPTPKPTKATVFTSSSTPVPERFLLKRPQVSRDLSKKPFSD